MVAQQDITHAWHIAAPLCQGCGHELSRDEIGPYATCASLRRSWEIRQPQGQVGCRHGRAGHYEHRRPGCVLVLAGHGGHYVGEARRALNLERIVTTGHAIRWSERYEEDRRN